MKLTEKDIKRFWSKVDKKPLERCWSWGGTSHTGGYGRFKVGRTNHLAHRVSYFLALGVNPGELCVCHSCDNRRCVKPTHLFLGTRVDNNSDMMAKNRGNWSQPCKGSQHGNSRFTEKDVIEIRNLWAAGELTQKQIAERFKTRQSVVSRIVKNRCWTHVPEAA